MSLPVCSSSQASMVSTSSSQLPLGGFHALDLALAGGVLSAGCFPFFFARLELPDGAAPDDGRPRFLVFLASCACSMSSSREPVSR